MPPVLPPGYAPVEHNKPAVNNYVRYHLIIHVHYMAQVWYTPYSGRKWSSGHHLKGGFISGVFLL